MRAGAPRPDAKKDWQKPKAKGGGKGAASKRQEGAKKVKAAASDRSLRALLRTDLTDEQERLFEAHGLNR